MALLITATQCVCRFPGSESKPLVSFLVDNIPAKRRTNICDGNRQVEYAHLQGDDALVCHLGEKLRRLLRTEGSRTKCWSRALSSRRAVRGRTAG